MPLLDFKKFGISNTGEYDYVIGFDLGDSQSSAAVFRMDDPAWIQPKDLYIGPDEATKITTALVYDADGNIVVAKTDALSAYAGTECQLASHFKVRPGRLLADEPHPGTPFTKRRLMVEFLKVAVGNIFRYNPASLLKGRGLLGIGCPSSPDWLDDDMDREYARILRPALEELGVNLDIVVMPESRAALLKAYRENTFDSDFCSAITKGVVVIDHGSSTLDVTAIDFNSNSQTDMSVNLGAKLIERAMLRHTLALHSLAEAELSLPMAWRLLDLRIAKEAHYSNPRGLQRVYFEKTDGLSFKTTIDTPFMKYVTSEFEVAYSSPSTGPVKGPWEKLHTDFLTGCLARISPGGEPFEGVVILTGGASRMDFTFEAARRVFGETARIKRDLDPGFCVSRGLAWGLHTDLEAMKLTGKVIEQSAEAIGGILRSHDFRRSLADGLAELVYQVAEGKIREWIDHRTSRSLQTVSAEIEQYLLKEADGRMRVSGVYKSCLRALLDRGGEGSIRAIVAATINRIFESYFPTRIHERSINTFSISSAEWTGIVEEVLSEADLSFSSCLTDNLDIESSLSKVIKGLASLLLLAPQLLAEIIDDIFDTSISDGLSRLTDDDRYKTYSLDERRKVHANLVAKKAEVISDLRAALVNEVISRDKADSLAADVVRYLRPAIDKAVDNVSLYFTVRK